MKDEVRVRPASKGDIGRMARVLADLPLFSSYGLDRETLAQRWTSGRTRGDGLFVAEAEGELLGICWFLQTGTFATAAYLRTLAVVPDAQGRGIGAALLAAFEAATRDASGGWFLLASDSNEGAHRFYQRHGYAEVGRLPGFARPAITERIFWKAPPAKAGQAPVPS